MKIKALSLIIVVVFSLCGQPYIFSDELSDLKKEMSMMKLRMEALEEKLKEKSTPEVATSSAVSTQPTLGGGLSEQIEKPEKEGHGIDSMLENLHWRPQKYPSLSFQGFSDVTYRFEKAANSADDENNHFALGQLGLFVIAAIDDRIDMLGETVIQYDDDNEAELHQERLWVRYTFNDHLKFKLGREHTPIGYWNTAYHHGGWHYTSIGRPTLVEFDDDFGPLPTHNVGLETSGKFDIDPLPFEYWFTVANGRGRTPTEITNVIDRNSSKALNLMLRFSPQAVEGLKAGFNIWYDKIPSNPDPDSSQLDEGIVARPGEMEELISGVHVVYDIHNWELIGEFSTIFHDDEDTGSDFDNYGAYASLARHFGKFTPYYRIDYMNFDEDDTFFAPNTIDVLTHHIGMRWDIVTFAAIKAEYSLSDGDSGSIVHSGTVNVSFYF
ncbi:MAG: hypothetical protein HYS07_02395 [Chlamydiae bacterium]|nr:hypothetical protein [Chlamydiota bacterium]MBI3276701.1 hypothetical protein [Chlamydiota bacterium]